MVHDREARPVEVGGEEPLGHGHTDTHPESLAEGSGGGFDTRSVPVLRMTRCHAAVLTESTYLLEWQVISVRVQQGVKHRGAVAGRQDEAVTVGPGRIDRVVTQEPIPQHVGHWRRPEW